MTNSFKWGNCIFISVNNYVETLLGGEQLLVEKTKQKELAAKNSICLEVQEVIPSLAKLKVSNWCKKVISTRAKTLNVKV